MMKTTLLQVLAALCICTPMLLAQPAINITSCIDNTIYEESTSLSNGSGDFIIVGRLPSSQGGHIRRGLIQTEFCFIPSNATVISVELNIQVQSGWGNVSLHKANKAWDEGTSDATGDETSGAAATANDATWGFSKFNSIPWDSNGGDFDATPSASSLAKGGETAVFSSSTMREEVQSWVNGAPNHGWLLKGNEGSTGTIISLKSGDILSGIPYITVRFTVPDRSVIINEVNVDNQWLELVNHGSTPVDISDWYLCNSGCDLFTSAEVGILNGSLIIPPGGYSRVGWTGITSGSGQIALMKSKANYFETMEDYLQYGSGNQSRSSIAVLAGVWGNQLLAAPSPIPGQSIGLIEGIYTSGEDSNSSYWDVQSPTPSAANTCASFLELSGSIALGNYAAHSIEMNGTTLTGSGVNLFYSEMVEFQEMAEISSGTTFCVIKTSCTN